LPDISRSDHLLVVLENLSEPVIAYDDSLHITWMNPAAEVFLGVSLERTRGLSCDQVFPSGTPCREDCPVADAFMEWRTSSLITRGLYRGERLVTAVPVQHGPEGRGVLEIIQWPFIEHSRSPFKIRILEELNGAFGLEEAARVMVDAMREVAGPVAAGVYRENGDGYALVTGTGVPPEIGRIPLLEESYSSSPLYTDASSITGWPPDGPFPEEVSVLPLFNGESPGGFMVCCSIPDSHGREKLEELRAAMNSAMRRLALAGNNRGV
jgi:hypothetical protein